MEHEILDENINYLSNSSFKKNIDIIQFFKENETVDLFDPELK